MALTHNQIYTAFNNCRSIYGTQEVHVQLLSKQLGVLPNEVLTYINNNPTLFTTRMNRINSGYTNQTLGNEFTGMLIISVTAIPFISTTSIIREGADGGTITLSISGDTFKASTSTSNWTINTGTTGLTLSAVGNGTATKVLTFTGTAQLGTISILCKAVGMDGGVASETIYFDVSALSVGYSTILGLQASIDALEARVDALEE